MEKHRALLVRLCKVASQQLGGLGPGSPDILPCANLSQGLNGPWVVKPGNPSCPRLSCQRRLGKGKSILWKTCNILGVPLLWHQLFENQLHVLITASRAR